MENKTLKLIETLRENEKELNVIKENIAAIQSPYVIVANFNLVIRTKDYENKGNNETIPFNKGLMVEYLTNHLEFLQKQRKELLEEYTKEVFK